MDSSWQPSDNWSILCTRTQWSSGWIPWTLLQTVSFRWEWKDLKTVYLYGIYCIFSGSWCCKSATHEIFTVKYRFEKKSYSEFIYGKLQSVLFFWSSQRWFEGIEKLIDQSWWKCQCGNHFQVCNFNHGDFCRRSNHGNVQDKEWHNQF